MTMMHSLDFNVGRAALALMAAGIALGVYAWTLAPGLVATLDTPAFQFVGRVLGVVHHPGYPLYTMVTHLVSYLPIGTLAYRINLFSAVMGAVAVGLTVLVLRRLDVRPLPAVAGALAFAFGEIVWSQSVIAEVYTLNAALVAGMLLGLLAWEARRRAAVFYLAIGCLALGLGHHTTIVLLAPAVALYVLLVDRRFALRLRTLAAVAALILAGLTQYLFVIVRSLTPGAYLESQATDLQGLAAIIAGRQFSDGLFAFPPGVVLLERLPWILGSVIAAELTVPGLLAAVVGLAVLGRRAPARALLLLGGILAMLGFVLNYDAVDIQVFTIPALLLLWIAAAVGIDAAVDLVPPRARPVAAGLVLLFPAWMLVQNWDASDRSRDTEAAWLMDAIFEALPDRAVLVREDFVIDRMVMYKLLGEDAAGGREIRIHPPSPAELQELRNQGFTVFAFGRSADALRYEGLDFAFTPSRIPAGRLAERLRAIPGGTVVALAVPAAHAAAFVAAESASLAALGIRDVAGLDQSSIVVLGTSGGQASRHEVSARGAARLAVDQTDRIGRARPSAPIQVLAGPESASIAFGSRDIIRTSDGVVVALWTRSGELLATFELSAATGFGLEAPLTPLALYPLGAGRPVSRLSEQWTDLQIRSGAFLLRVQPGTSVALSLGAASPLAARVIGQHGSALDVRIFRSDAEANGGRAAWPADHAAVEGHAPPYATWIEASLEASAGHPARVMVATGGAPRAAIGRLTAVASAASSADVREMTTTDLLRLAGRSTETLLMGRAYQQLLLGGNWSDVDGDIAGPFRWMRQAHASVLLPLEAPERRRIAVQALRSDDAGGPRVVRLRVNGVDLPSQPVQPGWRWYEWSVPPGTLVAGTNEARLIIDGLSPATAAGAEPRGLAVDRIMVLR
jgi:hypothetical protein